jgi:hypothetical protein
MDTMKIAIDPGATRLRRVGRLARRRMRLDGAALANGRHTDGIVTIEISGLGSPTAGAPDTFEWKADRPIALVIVRSGIDGEEVTFEVGPSERGVGRGGPVGDGSGIRYIAFCYDAPSARPAVGIPSASAPGVDSGLAAAAAIGRPAPARGAIAAARALALTPRQRRSILSMILTRPALGRAAF